MPRLPTPIPRPDDHTDAPPDSSRFQRLDGAAVRRSAQSLQQRINSRFPDRTLWEVCGEVVGIVDEINAGSGISRRRVRAARVLSRLGMLLIAISLGGAVALAIAQVVSSPGAVGPLDLLPLIETIINDLVFGGIAVFFLFSLPERMERARVLRILHRLRSLAHVIDMHQLTKVPERLERATREEGGMDLDRADLTRYLDFSTEMLSLVGKSAALFAEDTTDGDVLDAVQGIEALTSDMARKVWQKIGIIQQQS
ncbi:hypothetical protein Bra3105_04330 [Brachybacterium halotolerans subsp. kimchii]|uniref:hypothetical protein n=1 Tax=Brachybacterium halotolerans TaxID=2795215 RepID=UPI001E33EA43|nr:hypothetical protein [Brachybacterium halotolerans]UEJ83547.1 hypothetical protein Bra3105_04330 [Brachybacterium halotolerans subsp. kimchii]